MQRLSLEEFYKTPHPESEDGTFKMGHTGSTTIFKSMLEVLPPFSRNGPWLVGGTIRRLMVAETLTTDWDVMFKDESQFENFCGWLRERGAEPIEETTHQITFKYRGREVQAIRASYSNTLIQTLNKFDFTICQFGFDGTNLVWGDESGLHLKEKKLVFTQTNDPIATFRRAFKYAGQGFFMDSDGIAKFLRSVTEEQLNKAEAKWKGLATGGYVSFDAHDIQVDQLHLKSNEFLILKSQSQNYGGRSFAP